MAIQTVAYAGVLAAADHAAAVLSLAGLSVVLLAILVYGPLWVSPLACVPGPKLFALSRWRLALEDYRGSRTRCIRALHLSYGSAVRIGPAEVSFASLAALRAIYGAGSGFERTTFYRMFDVYGRQNLFTFAPVRQHAARKKLVAHAYSKTAVLRQDGAAVPLIARNVRSFLALLEQRVLAGEPDEIFRSLHWFSLDSITGFLYGTDRHGSTDALRGNEAHRRLLDDILNPERRRLSWFAVHLRAYTAWLYSRTGLLDRLIVALGLLPMSRPATYTAIRAHALASWLGYEADVGAGRTVLPDGATDASIMQRLHHHSQAGAKAGARSSLDGLDIASELADHFLAGIDTTSDASMFAIWALSRPEHAHYQARLQAELAALDYGCGVSEDGQIAALDEHGNPTADAADRLPFLDAVLRETLRLYAPLPASEPRVMPTTDVVIDGVHIPAGTVVSMDPYTLHRNPAVFQDPLAFRPERWLGEFGDVSEMRRWFWAFSSGGRMCIGMHLAIAEMTMLLSAIYRKYSTKLHARQEGVSPGITSRFEVFSDSTLSKVSVSGTSASFVFSSLSLIVTGT
ncbi:benzoate 4-monooxygenase cytochrome p450 [Grosmannia clavigera kw1407]|uniref:Benzoate 4-monooxygenase cytochrome p450 n=1 Tax=Grosmannia clavigera (strain kw1407 / UAMH 11150) TaxID=655863 RepID=F0XMT2_GROCL|nr:benzoate 4-monooxygenase cytochrome p450 [Grosmannia clavigera kw1407]EFX01133.1 benzoate 4-monooxygenase cytochrome p450 [Grosmannia clavigera kw1407]